jgi:hypothetical protein
MQFKFEESLKVQEEEKLTNLSDGARRVDTVAQRKSLLR